jgi:hypothetical protein
MQRSQSLSRSGAAAFDFDVVTDVPARPSRKPDARPETAPPAMAPQRADDQRRHRAEPPVAEAEAGR